MFENISTRYAGVGVLSLEIEVGHDVLRFCIDTTEGRLSRRNLKDDQLRLALMYLIDNGVFDDVVEEEGEPINLLSQMATKGIRRVSIKHVEFDVSFSESGFGLGRLELGQQGGVLVIHNHCLTKQKCLAVLMESIASFEKSLATNKEDVVGESTFSFVFDNVQV